MHWRSSRPCGPAHRHTRALRARGSAARRSRRVRHGWSRRGESGLAPTAGRTWAWRRSLTALSASCCGPASGSANASSRPEGISRLRRPRSRGSPATASPTPRLAPKAVYQPPDRPISPPQGLHQARHHVAQPTRRSAAARANRRSSLPRLTARPSACRSTLGGRTRTAHGAATDDAGGMVLLEDLE